jgi:hypothetical protein
MSEVGGITELQMIQQEISILKKELEGIKTAENFSVACPRVAARIMKHEAQDGFVAKEGDDGQNQFHTSGPTEEEGCCVVL